MKPGSWAARVAMAMFVGALAFGLALAHRTRAAREDLERRIAGLAQPAPGTEVPCQRLRAMQPRVLLVLGQSNAGNHGQAGGSGAAVPVISAAGTCHLTADPLPGGTGRGGSIWSHLPAALANLPASRPVVFSLLAVESTTLDDWGDTSGPLAPLLTDTVRAMREAGLMPELVLWQQGEADARAGSDPGRYALGLAALADRLAALGVQAPWVLARSTVCRTPPAPGLRAAAKALVDRDGRFRLGPDTDRLLAPQDRPDGCHFSESGLQGAARQWAQVLATEAISPPAGR